MKEQIKTFLGNNRKFFIGIIIGVIAISIIGYPKKNNYSLRDCSFQLLDIKEYKGKYGDYENADSYFIYEGLLKNTSIRTERLKAVITKLYNDKNIYIGEGYAPIEEFIGPDVSIPFKISIVISTYHDTVLRKYFSESNSFRADIYPWFTTCK